MSPSAGVASLVYRKIYVSTWQDERFRGLSAPQPNGQTLWVYLLAGEHTDTVPGLARAGEAALAEALGWPLDAFRRCWREIEGQGMAEADWSARVVWVPNAVAYNRPENPNVVKSWGRAWSGIPECALKDRARRHLEEHLRGRGESAPAFLDAFRESCPEPTPKRSRERSPKRLAPGMANQEQEQEQEQEKERELPGTSATPPAPSLDSSKTTIPDPARARVKALQAALEARYRDARGETYAHQGAKDTKALKRLVGLASDAEIDRRWRKGLSLGAKWPGCSTFAQLASKWNDLAAPANGNGIGAAPVGDFTNIPDGLAVFGD